MKENNVYYSIQFQIHSFKYVYVCKTYVLVCI